MTTPRRNSRSSFVGDCNPLNNIINDIRQNNKKNSNSNSNGNGNGNGQLLSTLNGSNKKVLYNDLLINNQ